MPTVSYMTHDLVMPHKELALLQTLHAAIAANLPVFVFHPDER